MRQAKGNVIVVRYADDFIMAFPSKTEAEAFLSALRKRLAHFGLRLHSGKTRLKAKLTEVKAERKGQRHNRVPQVGQWLDSVLRGKIQSYALPMNAPALQRFRFQIARL